MQRHGHLVGDALEHGGIGRDGGVDEICDGAASCLEARDPRRVDEIRIEREVKLNLCTSCSYCLHHQLALYLNRSIGELLHRLVGAVSRGEGV